MEAERRQNHEHDCCGWSSKGGGRPRLVIARLAALKQERENFVVVAHTLPPSAGVDGLLGLGFFHNQTLTLNFRDGLISLE